MTRRLVLLFTKAFIMNTVVRLLVMLLITILFVVHHVKVQTFQSNILNHTETGLLLMLTVICGLNILPAYNYMYPLSFSSFSRSLLEVFANIKMTLPLIFPVIAGFCITVLVFIRLLQLIVWLLSLMFRIIFICIQKYRSCKLTFKL